MSLLDFNIAKGERCALQYLVIWALIVRIHDDDLNTCQTFYLYQETMKFYFEKFKERQNWPLLRSHFVPQ